jgi:hypothetical protein
MAKMLSTGQIPGNLGEPASVNVMVPRSPVVTPRKRLALALGRRTTRLADVAE